MKQFGFSIGIMALFVTSCGDGIFAECDWSRQIYMACEIALDNTPCLGAITDERNAPSECWPGTGHGEQGSGVTRECIEAWGYRCVEACDDAANTLESGGQLDDETRADYETYCPQ